MYQNPLMFQILFWWQVLPFFTGSGVCITDSQPVALPYEFKQN